MKKKIIKAIKSSGIVGAIAALTVLIFGGWSGSVIGWLLGAGAGFIRCRNEKIYSPKIGARLGIEAGLALGIWLAIASVIEGVILRPSSGQFPVPFPTTLLYGTCSLAIATLAGGIMGTLQGIPGDRKRLATLVTLAFILISFPFVDAAAKTEWIATVVQIQIFIILALGLNIPVGFAGLLDLGYAAFFAIGAYTTGLLSSPQLGLYWNFWAVLPIAALVAAIAGVILGAPTLRLRGDYLAIVTLGFGEIIPVVFRNLTSVRIEEPISKLLGSIFGHPEIAICLLGCEQPINLTGGEAGINPIGRPFLPIVGTFSAGNYYPWYYLILCLVVFSYFMISRLRDSRLGRAWAAMREDELAASAMGINLVKTKLSAFAMGATFSGFAGAFYAAYISAIFPSVFDFSVSVIILCMVILGGLGNMSGVILGSIIIMSADRLYLPQLAQILKGFLNTSVLPNIASPELRDFLATSLDPIQLRLFLFGLTLVVMMIVRPEGLIPDKVHQSELHSDNEASNESLADARSQ
ncbi:branched-chain amino acid ABC transporter permease [Kamptonema sp. UHCC 0994]|uniref:branched-chain amino acid ABC transporter permease n=1 Tax=Kamptonema sp. UHCC 0994 TaxID=3031329 RepID=UPI0023B9DF16|nr:branched-chain amino acid ABC transporter permease [Kamptonema sp. UHCC 0994]MDF0554247.1 branched-chain amino acid ABC transporter permease [Kamptonema sp. UHCC 0994]